MKIPAEPRPEQLTVIIDSREQLPFDLAPLKMETATLVTGDYFIKGLEHVISYERKSLSDQVVCCGPERKRFEAELQRMLAYPVRAVIVESDWGEIELGGWRSNITPKSVIGSILGWQAWGIPFVLAGRRERAQDFCRRMLFIAARREWRKLRALAGGVLEEAETCGTEKTPA